MRDEADAEFVGGAFEAEGYHGGIEKGWWGIWDLELRLMGVGCCVGTEFSV